MKRNKKMVVTRTPRELAGVMGLTPSDALEWEIRRSVTQKIMDVMKKRPMTVTELARNSGTSRARVTKIIKGESFGISLDVLFRILGATGHLVRLNYKKAA